MWIMVSGPYTTGGANAAKRTANLKALNEAAVALFRRGHVPMIGVNVALPMVEAAGKGSFDEIMMPMSLKVAERCDAVLRIGGESGGADHEVASFRRRGKPVYTRLEDVPDA